ncbi:intercellular adhesion molecule 5 [Colossoma macropomum]|uniref:intercellular adhesion molecule 5 n=1 Tax=Colossoma macropomum TaxID=42526 RepID=UPI0018651623|nr:intercellular adhesion molecule 5 [Colossoma macropomum]
MLLLPKLAGLALIVLINGNPCPLTLQPPEVVVEYGASASANCSTSVDHVGMGWEASQGPVDMKDDVQLITWSVDTLVEWGIKPFCFMNSNPEKQCKVDLAVTIYKTPDRVSISTVDHTGPMIEGGQYELQCDIQNVAPVEFLTVSWFKGDTLVKNVTFTDLIKTPVNRSDTLQIFPSRDDDVAQYRCEAELDLGPEGPQPPPTVTSDPLTITVHDPCPLTLQPPEVVAEYGASASANCSTSVDHMGIGWEASQGPVDMKDDVQLITWSVDTLVEWGIKPFCFMNPNPEKQCKVDLHVTIYKTPDRVSISTVGHTGPMIEGGQYELQCDIENVAPVEFLTVSWFKGDTLVKNVTFTDLIKTPVNLSDTLQISPSRDDDGAQYRCEAELDLGPEGPQPPPTVTSDPFTITVYDPCPLTLQPPEVVAEYGGSASANCSTSVDHVGIGWEASQGPVDMKDDVQLVTWSVDRLVEWGIKPFCFINPNPEKQCKVDLHVTIYKTPDRVSISTVGHTGPMIEAGQYELQCDIENVAPVEFHTVSWFKGDTLVKNVTFTDPIKTPVNRSSILQISPSRDDDGVQYRCEAELNLGPEGPQPPPTVTSDPLTITVHLTRSRRLYLKDFRRITSLHSASFTIVVIAAGFRAGPAMLLLAKLAGLALIMLINGGGACPPDLNDLELEPPSIVVEYGDRVSVNCSSSSNFTELSWKGLPEHVSSNDIATVTWETDSLTDWDIQPECHMNLSNVQCNRALPLIIYKTPDRVSISIVGHTGPMIEGEQYELQCDIQNVAPVEFLTVSWYKGDTLVKNVNFTDSIKTPVNLSDTFQISPSRDDDGAQYRCEAELDLGPDGPQPPPRVISGPLNITVHDPCPLTLHPPKVVVEYGGSASANCSTSVDHVGMGWEASQGPVDMKDDVQLVTWNVDRLVEWGIKPFCFMNPNPEKQCKVDLAVTIYKTPDRVSISAVGHTGPMIEGGQYELQCDIENVAPVEFLTVSWFKGDTLVKNVNFTDSIKTPVNRSSTLQISPSRDYNGAQYRCVAELDLGPEGPQPPPKVTSDPFNITVHYMPVIHCSDWNPLINTPLSSYPYSVMGNPRPLTSWHQENSRIKSTKRLSKDDSGQYKYLASNKINTAVCVTNITVEYGPEFNCSSVYESREHTLFLADCTVMASPVANVSWSRDGRNVERPHNLTRRENGLYNITAQNKHGTKHHLLTINVLYGPEIESGDESVEVYKGRDVTLRCTAEGNPEPNITWSFNNQSKTTGGRQTTLTISGATFADGGLYTCTATNTIGSQTRTVLLVVQDGPEFNCPSVYESREHTLFLADCTVMASPVANVSWSRDGRNVERPHNLTRRENGLYNITAQNKHGTKHHLLTINVLYGPEIESGDESVEVYKGRDVTLRCTAEGNPEPNITWSFNNQSKTTGGRQTTLTISGATFADSGLYTCTATNTIGSQTRTVLLVVQEIPDRVSISTVGHTGAMTEGGKYDLQCEVQKASPVEFLTVSWLKGDTLVKSKNFTNSTKTPENVFDTLQISPSRDDDGAQYRCEAELDLGPDRPQPPLKVTSDPLTITVEYPCPLTLQPPKVMVEYGGSASANCSTSVDHVGMGWEASQGPVDMQDDVQLVTWNVDRLVEWGIKPFCFMNPNPEKQCKVDLHVTIYKTPDRVSISTVGHTGPMIEGGQYELQCDIENVAPVEFLTVSWFKGDTLVDKEIFNNPIKTPVNLSDTLQISTSRDDDGVQYRCEAELDLGPEGPQPPPRVTSEPLNITVHYKPVTHCSEWSPLINSKLSSYPYAVKGNPLPVVHWFQGQSQVKPTKRLSQNDSGQYNFTAMNIIGSTSCVIKITVEYGPKFDCPQSYEDREHTVFLEICKVMASPLADVTWYKDREKVKPPHNLTRRDNGSYSITAQNKHGTEHHHLTINVLYGPEIKSGDGSVEVYVGRDVTLSCIAEGIPEPKVKWSFNNQSKTTGGRQTTLAISGATFADGGLYTCTATNKIGSQTRRVLLVVQDNKFPLPLAIIIALSILFIVICILIIFACIKRKRSGRYDVQCNDKATEMMPLSKNTN